MNGQEPVPSPGEANVFPPASVRVRVGVSTYALGVAAVLVGLALRAAYAANASPYIDEFTTIWAAQRVLTHGLPRFPSGVFYTQGLLYTYLEAGALALGQGFSLLVARLPSLALSAVTLATLVYAARRLFRTWPVGLAAFWLAVDPQGIIWGARARTYSLLQILVLVAFLAWYHGAVSGDRPKARWLAIGLLAAALIEQPLSLLLLLPLAILALAARGWRWLRQPVVWLQAGVMVVFVAARWFLYQLMVPSGATATDGARAFVDLTQPLVAWESLMNYFTSPNRWIPAVLLAVGAISMLLFRRLWTISPRRSVLSIAFILAFVTVEMLLVVGPSWRAPRYLFPLLPLLFLGAEGVLVPILRWLSERVPRLSSARALVALTGALVLVITLLAYPDALVATTRDEWGYDRAMAIVGSDWVEGDALATIAPAAAYVILGDADYLAVQEGAQALAVERGGRRVDSWTGLPFLDSPAGLAEALESHSRLWFVIDETRLDDHFSPDFLHLLWDRMDLIAFERGTFVFRSRKAEAPPAISRPLDIVFDDQLRLAGYSLSDDRPEAGETVTITLRWEPVAPEGEYVAFVHLVNQAGEGLVGHDAPPLDGRYPTSHWTRSSRSQPLPDRHPLVLPDDLPPGRYRLEVGLYRPGTLEAVGERVTLDYLSVGEQVQAALPESPLATFANGTALYLCGLHGELRPGGVARLCLAWQSGPRGFEDDYTVFLHLTDAEGHIAQQWDAPPTGGWYPTSYWKPGEVVLDDHTLDLSPMLPPGRYHLIAGLYLPDGTRLPLENGLDFVELATIELKP
jgi:hypothetical protein